MEWIKKGNTKIPIISWCKDIEEEAMRQAFNLANHPKLFNHVALMPDCHVGYGMPIGGVIACDNAVIPNAVGVDIGCGMGAVKTDYEAKRLNDKRKIREILDYIKEKIPLGEGHSHDILQEWDGFNDYVKSIGVYKGVINNFNSSKIPEWLDEHGWKLDSKNLGTLGGGNHFIELQKGNDGYIWLMLHSGSRNLGHRIASYYHNKAVEINERSKVVLPDKNLSYLDYDTEEGRAYVRDMIFALLYAGENRKCMMTVFKEAVLKFLKNISFTEEINIHHNYAALENHFNKNVWVHRKGATSAKKGEMGIIPGSMGAPSYIVKGLGNQDSFMSCSHGAGRRMGRMQACRNLNIHDCDKAMEGVVFDRWKKLRKGNKSNKNLFDLGESPLAYKDIDEVIHAQLDLIEPVVKLRPLGVLKG